MTDTSCALLLREFRLAVLAVWSIIHITLETMLTLVYFLSLMIFVALIVAIPLQKPPDDFVSGYSMEASVPIDYFYVVEDGSTYRYPKTAIVRTKKSAQRNLDLIRSKMELMEDPDLLNLPMQLWSTASMYMYQDAFVGANVAVFGSVDPYFESVAIVLGASSITTFEYNDLTFEDDNMDIIWGENYYSLISQNGGSLNGTFDVVLSYSSFDHSGLGRYGDPLNPNGDIEAMSFAADVLKENGVMLLTVPVGPDVCVFNLHRRYGKKRLFKLLEGGELDVVERLGWIEDKLDEDASWRQTYEPVFVLKKKSAINDKEL